MTVVAVSPHMGNFAFDAYHRFGKGTGHGAALNYGDCFSYALARHLDAPLRFLLDRHPGGHRRSVTERRGSVIGRRCRVGGDPL